ncbi:PREDICTED: probable receptor-like serine/threonine-protein kinase At5g57670 [Lupinus angustifolius]|uniref:probable receptor-like serine/threonine-protein kinase At5g57670 n=1 Tax=Lupinus angustifolius TaxID=3871 RepID=UPI00092E520E|nr:PREDICTED: probable receptor-like serine/threonine-protein kinase At5g57670 [Lupinus angustifolius]XP_019458718.1 PREDICTED: probable receptor-like serine/threonine-protein kinase At5g57670 [Lupinus angustifolius]
MNLSDHGGDGGGGRTVLVAVKLDHRSRELLTWSLVKVAEPGDLVIALHAIDTGTEDDTASLLSIVKTFDSVLTAYKGFCNLKQIGLELKVCRGVSVRKLVVQEAKSLDIAAVILGTKKTSHPIQSSASVAKYCAKKLPKRVSVFAVGNGKVAFRREPTGMCEPQVKLNESPKLLNKSLASYTKKRLKNCESCTWGLSSQENSATKLNQGFSNGHEEESSLALIPIQKLDDVPNYSVVVCKSNRSKPAWSFLRKVFLPKNHTQKSPLENSSVFQQASRQPNCHSSDVVHQENKLKTGQNDKSTLDGESGAIVPFGSDDIILPPSLCSDLSGLAKDLLVLREKYSSTCRLYSFQELAAATANFSHENLVGTGGCSHVYRGCLLDGKELAIKSLKSSEDVIKEFVHEIEIVTTLHHTNIITLSGFCYEGNNLLLVYDLLSRGSLEQNLYGNKNDCNAFGWQERYKVAVGVAEALNYLHNGCTHAVIHRDVKSSNILLSDDFEPQLSDFGLASRVSSSHSICTDVAGTFGYLAPEYFMHGRVTDKIDVYAFGVVLLELLSSKKPINNESPKGQESLVMWATPILKDGKLSQLLDPSLGSDYNQCHIERMVLAATLCIRRSPRLRPQICLLLKLLHGDVEVTRWAEQEVRVSHELVDGCDGELVSNNILSHLDLALLDLEDDTDSISSTEQTLSFEDYLRRRWSGSSSFG